MILHHRLIEAHEVFAKRPIQFLERVENLRPRFLKKSALNRSDRCLHTRLVARLVRPRRQHAKARMIGVLAVSWIGVGVVTMRPAHCRFQIVHHRVRRHAAEKTPHPLVRGDERIEALIPYELAKGVRAERQHAHEQMRLGLFTGGVIGDHNPVAIIDLHLAADHVLPSQRHLGLRRQVLLELAPKAQIAHLGRQLLVQLLDAHTLATHLLFSFLPVDGAVPLHAPFDRICFRLLCSIHRVATHRLARHAQRSRHFANRHSLSHQYFYLRLHLSAYPVSGHLQTPLKRPVIGSRRCWLQLCPNELDHLKTPGQPP